MIRYQSSNESGPATDGRYRSHQTSHDVRSERHRTGGDSENVVMLAATVVTAAVLGVVLGFLTGRQRRRRGFLRSPFGIR